MTDKKGETMSDTSTPGDRLDTKLAEMRQTVDELRAAIEAAGDNMRGRVVALVDELSAKIDELQEAWDTR